MEDAIDLLRSKLRHLLAQEAIAADAAKKFQIKQEIAETQRELAEAESRFACGPGTKNSDDSIPSHWIWDGMLSSEFFVPGPQANLLSASASSLWVSAISCFIWNFFAASAAIASCASKCRSFERNRSIASSMAACS